MNSTKPEVRLVWRKVSDMYVQCTFPMRPDVVAMSDCCRRNAQTAVHRPDGVWTWRCSTHEGMIDSGQHGEVSDAVLVRYEDWMDYHTVPWSETKEGDYDRRDMSAYMNDIYCEQY